MVSFNSFTNSKTTKQLENVLNNIKSAKCWEVFSCISRCLLVFLSSSALLCALILIATGIIQQASYPVEFGQLTSIDTTLICVGLIIAIIAFFAFLGAIIENVRLLMVYAIIQMTAFIILFTLGSTFYAAVVNSVIQSKLVSEMIIRFLNKNRDIDMFGLFNDKLQQFYQCCGVNGPQDLAINRYGEKTLYVHCCSSGYSCFVEEAYQNSCVPILDDNLLDIINYFSGLFLILCGFQVFCAALAYFMGRTIKKRTLKYERIPEVFTIDSK